MARPEFCLVVSRLRFPFHKLTHLISQCNTTFPKIVLIIQISDRDPGHRVLASRERDWRATTRDCVKGLLDFHLL